jgi:hypothetical protein
MNFKSWILDLFKDERGSTSIKPVVAFMCALFLCITLTANSFNHKDIAPSDGLVDAVMYICIAAMLGDTGDKFSLRKKLDPPTTDE